MAWYSETQYYSTSNGISLVGIIIVLVLLLILIIICIGIGVSIWWWLTKKQSTDEAEEPKRNDARISTDLS